VQLLIDKGADIKAEDKVRTSELALRERRPRIAGVEHTYWLSLHMLLAVIA
jgi:hypothetical protein